LPGTISRYLIVSVLALERTYFVLVVHPFFLPETDYPKGLVSKLIHRDIQMLPDYMDDWDGLWYPGRIKIRKIGEQRPGESAHSFPVCRGSALSDGTEAAQAV